MNRIFFLGAAKTVTGSCYLLEINNQKLLIDCGMFQGPDVYQKNYLDFKFNPSEISAVLLTHAHLDHCGLLPKLVKFGFKGNIYCTIPTAHILEHILIDSANVQSNNLKYKGIQPLYAYHDVAKTLKMLSIIKYNSPKNIGNLIITFLRASHILGASSIKVKSDDLNVLFSGDLGRKNPNLIHTYDEFSNDTINYIVMESLYGGRNHINSNKAYKLLCKEITHTFESDGNVIIPVFAIQRHQEILRLLIKAYREGILPQNVQIYSDTPLGKKILDCYTDHPDYLSQKLNNIKDPFGLNTNNLHFVQKNRESKNLKRKKKIIILAGSGMMEGGRIINHLFSFAHKKNCTFIIVGYQAEETLGRHFISRPKKLQVFNKKFPLNANISEIYGFSAHADQKDLYWWLKNNTSEELKTVFLTHATNNQSTQFINYIKKQDFDRPNTKFIVPNLNNSFKL